MNAHIIAVDTYGAQRVTAPQTGKLVSAYKLGYTTAVTAVLLALYGEKARDVSPKQASYRYVQIDGDVVVRHGHILLTLTADELERRNRSHARATVPAYFCGVIKSGGRSPTAAIPTTPNPATTRVRISTRRAFVRRRLRRVNARQRSPALQQREANEVPPRSRGGGYRARPIRTGNCSSGSGHVSAHAASNGTSSGWNCPPRSGRW